MSILGDRLIRLLGADPVVYRPVARVQALMIQRRARLMRRGGGSLRIPPFYVLCFITFVMGIVVSGVNLVIGPRLIGTEVLFTLGAFLLFFTVMFDDFDVLVNPSEYLVLAAHPHDAWSILLAKLVAVGRSLAVLGACYFVPGALGLALSSRDPLAAVALLVGAAGLTVALGSGGMLVAAALVALWGRKAMDRLLPVVQVAYLLGLLLSRASKQAVQHIAPLLPHLRAAQWFIPTVWFVWPVELVLGPRTGATLLRAALSTGALVAVVASGATWIGGRFGERLLDPPSTRVRRREAGARGEPRSAKARGWASLLMRTPESRAVLKLWSAHLKSDTVFRSNLIGTTFSPLILLASIFLGRGAKVFTSRPEWVAPALGIGLTMMVGSFLRMLSMSSRPEALWAILTSPADRSKFSLATVSAVRALVMIPYLAVIAGVAIALKAGPPWAVLLTLLSMGILAEALLRFWRGFYHAMPFSLPMRSAGKMGGAQILTMFGGMVLGAGSVTLLPLAQRLGIWAQVTVLGAFSGLLVAASIWMRSRVSGIARAFELRSDA